MYTVTLSLLSAPSQTYGRDTIPGDLQFLVVLPRFAHAPTRRVRKRGCRLNEAAADRRHWHRVRGLWTRCTPELFFAGGNGSHGPHVWGGSGAAGRHCTLSRGCFQLVSCPPAGNAPPPSLPATAGAPRGVSRGVKPRSPLPPPRRWGVTDFHRLPRLSPLLSSFSSPHRWRLPLWLRRRLVPFSFPLPFSSVARAACCAAVCPGRIMVNRCAAVVAAPPPSPSSLQAEGCRRCRGRRGRRVQTGGERGAPDPLRRAA